jgi:hypothetical protein
MPDRARGVEQAAATQEVLDVNKLGLARSTHT